jgi:Zn-dependent membrane protease YugP
MFYFDPLYLILVVLPAAVLSGLAQMYIRSTYSKWSQIPNQKGINGAQTGALIMRNNGLQVQLDRTPQPLGDHFDPREGIVRLSPEVASQPSVASMAIAAHEFGHVQQHAQGSILMAARGFLLPAVQLSPMISYGLILVGIIFNMAGLAWLGVAFFALTVLFMLLTLPIEIDASVRAMKMLNAGGLITTDEERAGARSVLTAAALTYIAAAITAILQLVYYASLVSRSDD